MPWELRTPKFLTSRRKEVLHWLVRGKTNDEIAQLMDLYPTTVKNHIYQLGKLFGTEGPKNRILLAVSAVLRGDVDVRMLKNEYTAMVLAAGTLKSPQETPLNGSH